MKKYICAILACMLLFSIAATALAVEEPALKPIPDDIYTVLQELSALWPNDSYPDDVGGIAYNNEQNKLIVRLTSNTAARQAEIRRLVSYPAALQFASCKYSYQQLRAAQEDIITRYGLGEQSGIAAIGIGGSYQKAKNSLTPGFGVSGFESRVVVSVATDQAYNKLQNQCAARYGDMVYVERMPGYIPKTDADITEVNTVFETPRQAAATGRANVRSGCGTSYKKLGKLKKGQELQVLALAGEWAEIIWEDDVAFVHMDYIRLIGMESSEEVAPAKGQAAAATGRVNVRSGPGTSYRRLGRLKKDEAALVTAMEGDWARIAWKNGESAYVYANYLRITP